MRTTLKKIIESSCTGLDAIKRAPIVETNTGLSCLRIQDISQSKPFNLWGYTSAAPNSIQKFLIRENDIFIARTGASIGCCIIISKDINSVFNNGLIRLRALKTLCYPKYLYYLLSSNKVQQHIYGIALASATQPNMKINDLLDCVINLPSLEIQQHIVNTTSFLLLKSF